MVVALALVLVGIAGPARAADRTSVVASSYPIAWAAQQVGGARVNVTNLTPAGAEPHESWPRQLQGALDARQRPVEVLNVALWGWSTREERMAYQRIARRYAGMLSDGIAEGSIRAIDPLVASQTMMALQNAAFDMRKWAGTMPREKAVAFYASTIVFGLFDDRVLGF